MSQSMKGKSKAKASEFSNYYFSHLLFSFTFKTFHVSKQLVSLA